MIRARSSAVRIPLSLTSTISEGTSSLNFSVTPEIDFKGSEVAVIDADNACLGFQRALELRQGVNFHEGIELIERRGFQ